MDLVLSLFAFLFGAAVGSFLNVCIYRLPRPGLTVARPRRSFCPSCGEAIRAVDNVPILSWLWLRGQCRSCRHPISPRYVLVEALTGSLFLFLAWQYLLGPDGLQWGAFAVVSVLTAALLVASFIDLELRIIPDVITIPGMMLAPLAVLLAPQLRDEPPDGWVAGLWDRLSDALGAAWGWLPPAVAGRGWSALAAGLAAAAAAFGAGLYGFALYNRVVHARQAPRPLSSGLLGGVLAAMAVLVLALAAAPQPWVSTARAVSFCSALLGMAAGAGIVLLVGVVGSWAFRKPAMGFGDVKLMGLLGAFAGPVGVVAGFFIACLIGSVVGIAVMIRTRSRYIPFGPFLALGAWLTVLCPRALDQAWTWYLDLFR